MIFNYLKSKLDCSHAFYVIALAVVLNAKVSNAQSVSQILSIKHVQKIENETSARRKLKSYKKFYSKDSIEQVKQLEKYWQSKSDSLVAAVKERENELAGKANELPKRASRKLNKQIEKFSQSNSKSDTLNLKLDTLNFNGASDNLLSGKGQSLKGNTDLNLPDQTDPLIKVNQQTQKVENKVLENNYVSEEKQLTVEAKEIANEVKGYQGDLKKYQGQLELYVENDSLAKQDIKNKVVAEVQNRAGGYKELQALDAYKKKVEALDVSQGEYKQQFDQLQDSAYWKDQARKKAEEMALDYIAENPAIMNNAKNKMDLLMKKYSIVPNSNDLSTAVKRTTMEGRSFKERLYLAGNFQVLSLKPVSFDFSPMIGYRFNTKFVAGVGGNYRKTFGDVDSLTRFASDMMGYKAFVSFDVVKDFFVYTELASNTTGIDQTETSDKRIWETSFLLGAGRKFTIHPKVEMTMVVLYNFARKPGDTVYPSPWVVRFGFQCSEIAFLKRKVNR